MAIGYIYIIRNPSHESNVYKVGKTSRTIDERLKELNAETSNIGTFDLIKSFMVSDIDKAESESHEALSSMRVQNNREFFKASVGELEDIVSNICDKYSIQNNNQSNNINIEDLISKLSKNISMLREAIDDYEPVPKPMSDEELAESGFIESSVCSFQEQLEVKPNNHLTEEELRTLLSVDLELKIGKISGNDEFFLVRFMFNDISNINVVVVIGQLPDEKPMSKGDYRYAYSITLHGQNDLHCFIGQFASGHDYRRCFIETPEPNEMIGKHAKKFLNAFAKEFECVIGKP